MHCATDTRHEYTTQSHYPDTEPTSPGFMVAMFTIIQLTINGYVYIQLISAVVRYSLVRRFRFRYTIQYKPHLCYKQIVLTIKYSFILSSKYQNRRYTMKTQRYMTHQDTSPGSWLDSRISGYHLLLKSNNLLPYLCCVVCIPCKSLNNNVCYIRLQFR